MVLVGDEAPAEFDFHCPMMSLPLAYSTTLETIPVASPSPATPKTIPQTTSKRDTSQTVPQPTTECETFEIIPRTVPYLAADAAAVAAWHERLSALPGLRVGLCWAGNPRRDHPSAYAIDRRRSITLAQYAPLANVAGVHFVSLQKGDAAGQTVAPPIGLSLHDWTDELLDFADTAALIQALDLVITVDTAVAHLAGALGKPVWILNRFDACWRWLVDRDNSPWYPTARLFRQPKPDDWDSVVAKVATALHDRVHHAPPAAIRGGGPCLRGMSSADGVLRRVTATSR